MKSAPFGDLGRNVLLTFSRQIITVLLALLTSILIARVLGTEGNGYFGVALLVPMLLARFCDLGISVANTYFIGRQDVSIRQAWRTTRRFWLAMIAVGVALGGSTLWLFSELLFPGVPAVYLWLGLALYPLLLAQGYTASLLRGAQAFAWFNFLFLAGSLLMLAAALLLVWFAGAGVAGALGAYAVGWALQSSIGWWQVRRLIREEPPMPMMTGFGRKSFDYGWKSQASIVLSFMTYRIDTLIVNALLSPAAAGVYIIAGQLAERLWLLSQSVGTVILPRLSQLHTDEARRLRLTPLILRWVLLMTISGALLLLLLGYPLIILLFGREYIGAYAAMVALLPGIILLSGGRVLANDLSARGRPDFNVGVSVAAIIMNIVANFVLIPRWGLVGAALASTAAYGFNALLTLLIYVRITNNRLGSVFVPTQDDRVVLQWGYSGLRRQLSRAKVRVG